MSKNTRNRILLTAVAALLLVVMTVGGTVAYLTAKSQEVKNTFKPSAITVDINEHVYDPATGDVTTAVTKTNNNYQFIPGFDMEKDPYVTVTNDVDCYVFLTHTKPANWPEWATYTIDTSEWTELEAGVWYKEVAANATDKEFNVITGQTITVPTTVTATELNALYSNGTAVELELVFNAYACQKLPFTSAAEAWATANPAGL